MARASRKACARPLADVAAAAGTRTLMADLSTPLNWKSPPGPPRATGAVPAADETPAKEKGSRDAFLWPTPPYASYPAPTEQTETLPCQILVRAGLSPIAARPTFFVPETSVAHVQMP